VALRHARHGRDVVHAEAWPSLGNGDEDRRDELATSRFAMGSPSITSAIGLGAG
jgi:hypothetical protein